MIQGDETIVPATSGETYWNTTELAIQGDETVTTSVNSVGSSVYFNSGAWIGTGNTTSGTGTNKFEVVYDWIHHKIIVFFIDEGNNDYPTYIIGRIVPGQQEIGSNTITWGSKVVIHSSAAGNSTMTGTFLSLIHI